MKDGAEPPREEPACLDRIPEGLWAGWCRNINVSRLDRFPLGFFARSLRNLPLRLWEVRVILTLSDGTELYPMVDDEENDAGVPIARSPDGRETHLSNLDG